MPESVEPNRLACGRSPTIDSLENHITFDDLEVVDEIIASIRRDGIARVPGYFDDTRMLEDLDCEMAEVFRTDASWINHYPDSPWPGNLAKIVTAKAEAEQRMPVARRIMNASTMRAVVEGCAGASADCLVPIIKYSHEWIHGQRNIALHYDWVRSVKWVCFLSDVDADNGAITVRVGSHRPIITLAQALLRQGFHVRDLPCRAEIFRDEPPSASHPDGVTEFALTGNGQPRIHIRVNEYFPPTLMTGKRGDLYFFDGAILHLGGVLAHDGCSRKLVRGHGRTREHWGDSKPDRHGPIQILSSTRPIAPEPGFSVLSS